MTWAFSFLLAFSFLAGALVILPQGVRADPINAVINSGVDDRGLLIQDGSTFADARE